MNKKQRTCLWLGIIIVVMMGICPPFSIPPQTIKVPCTPEETARVVAAYEAELSADGIDSGIDSDSIDFNENPAITITYVRPTREYGLLFKSDRWFVNRCIKKHFSRLDYNVHSLGIRFSLDLGRLCVQWAIVAVITGCLICMFKDRPKDKEKEGTSK